MTPRSRPHRAGADEVRSPLTWLGGLLAVYLLAPIGYFVYRFAISNERGLGQPGLGGAFLVSAETASISTAIIALLGVPLAYWLGRSRSTPSAIVGVLVQLPLALPPVMSGIVLIYVVGPYTSIGSFFADRLTDSIAGVVLAQTFVAAPFLIIAARSAFSTVDQALFDVAETCGHGRMSRFLLVGLPVAAQGIRAGLLLTWLRALGEYGATVLLAYHPYTLPVYTSVQFGSTGLPLTQAPTALALGLAAIGLVLNALRRPRGWYRRTSIAASQAPGPAVPVPLTFDLDHTVGDFHLRLRHTATTSRIAILGPSGSGKSMTLRALAGLLGPQVGRVHFAGVDVSRVPSSARGVGYVPQTHGLLPHRRVWRNVLLGVHAEPGLAAWWLRALKLDGLETRLPHELSGGQRQRVSLAQAMARRPRVVLLDEPFSALDAPVRRELSTELRRLQRETNLSSVLVTHDPEEAALLADEILVIVDGQLVQAGPREAVFSRPADARIARLLGIENVVAGRVEASGRVSCGASSVPADTTGHAVGDDVAWCVRAECIHIDPEGPVIGVVDDVLNLGTVQVVTVRLRDGPLLRARCATAGPVTVGDGCRLRIDDGAIALCGVNGLQSVTRALG
ncbi:ATP-binding cassette domain-containing protein [Jatrophihabitans endophyticus]|uniref:ABC transporter ATP-binding protein/permease n=1 Tax=Jatrophihabitans endophyticus TaxID=1206085 RepID=UPI0019FF93DB|nr:ATP-binding cassette domain-containing protein [Jatrophihabitans endophyticus]MBE7189855.1 ATP-binding cassette domain-containing protein [Jatrophihabitans endophyticus]